MILKEKLLLYITGYQRGTKSLMSPAAYPL